MIAGAVALLAIGWLASLIVAPRLPAEAAGLLYAFAGLICHQRPERSFHLDAFQLPVCARCLGLYAGAAAGACAAVLTARRPSRSGGALAGGPRAGVRSTDGPWRDGDGVRIATIAALLPTAVTVALEWAGLWAPSNGTRAVAALPAGFVVALVVTHAMATVHYGECVRRPPTVPNPDRPST